MNNGFTSFINFMAFSEYLKFLREFTSLLLFLGFLSSQPVEESYLYGLWSDK